MAGDDWRTTGLVAASGTITHDGQSVDVVVTVDEESAAFYWDRPEQLLYDSVKFPMTVPNARDNFDSISFDDLNGDRGDRRDRGLLHRRRGRDPSGLAVGA